MTTQQVPYSLLLRIAKIESKLEKFNSCHGADDGKFCSTSGAKGSSIVPVSSDRIGGEVAGVDPPPPTKEERAAISTYKTFGYADMNDHLLGKPLSTPGSSRPEVVQFRQNKIKEDVELLSAVINRSSLEKDTVLYRGMGGPRANALAKLPPGSEFSIPAFQSTSYSKKIAIDFALGGSKTGREKKKPPVLFEISAKKGTKGLEIEKFANIKIRKEKEIVLNKGLSYRVLGTKTVEHRIGGGIIGNYEKIKVVSIEVL